MAENEPCPFCKSEKRLVETPYVDSAGSPVTSFCCKAMKTNQKFIKDRYHPSRGTKPSVDDVSTW